MRKSFKAAMPLVLMFVVITLWLTLANKPAQTQLPSGFPAFPGLAASGPQLMPRYYYRVDSLASVTGTLGTVPGKQRILKTGSISGSLKDTTEAFPTIGARIPAILWQVVNVGTGDSLNASLDLQVSNNPNPPKNSSWLSIKKYGAGSIDTFYTGTSITTEKFRYVYPQVPDTVSYFQAARFVITSFTTDTTRFVVRPTIIYDDAGFMSTRRSSSTSP